MKNIIIYTNETGGVSICIPTGEIPIEEVQRKDIPKEVQSYIISSDLLPEAHNDFFNAWEQSYGKVSVNLDKAKELTKERLRIEREPLLAAQDIAFQRALESGEDVSSIVAEKNRLRNITNSVNDCVSLDDLRSLKA